MRRGLLVFVLCSASVVLFLSPAKLFASRGVVSEANIEDMDGCAVIVVRFNFPVRYVSHFPDESADEVRVQFEPIAMATSDLEDRFEREDVRFLPDDRVPLSEIIFEGNIMGGPYLTLTFLRSLAFEVTQGADFRSLVVTPFQDIERAECFSID